MSPSKESLSKESPSEESRSEHRSANPAARSTFAALQRLAPQHGLSRVGGTLAKTRNPWIRRTLIRNFARVYKVNMADAARESLEDYTSFNDFFTRELKPDARPLCPDPDVAVSPADGIISQAGTIDHGQLLQAKGSAYALEALAGEKADQFDGGCFATIYLAPHDYHRVHIPVAGTLSRYRAIPGALYSVNAMTEAEIPGLFARNERLVCYFDTSHGEMLVVLVGAMIVASIETVWGAPVSPYRAQQEDSPESVQSFDAGVEIGRFLLGSTVIVCMQPARATLVESLSPGSSIQVGEPLMRLASGSPEASLRRALSPTTKGPG